MRIFADNGASGSVADRPGLARTREALKAGNRLIVQKLDGLGRSLAHFVPTIAELGSSRRAFRVRQWAYGFVDRRLAPRRLVPYSDKAPSGSSRGASLFPLHTKNR